MYHYQKEAGGGLPQGIQERLRQCTFSEFLRMPNKYFMPTRGFQQRDKNPVVFWASHVEEWFAVKRVVRVSFESLLHNFTGVSEIKL